jgi:hypothetical protein
MEVYDSKTGPTSPQAARDLARQHRGSAALAQSEPHRWHRPESRTEEDKLKLIRERDALMLAQADEATKKKLRAARKQRDPCLQLPAPQKVYAGAVHYGSGAFKGTHGTPRTIQVLKRGDIKQPAQEVGQARSQR